MKKSLIALVAIVIAAGLFSILRILQVDSQISLFITAALIFGSLASLGILGWIDSAWTYTFVALSILSVVLILGSHANFQERYIPRCGDDICGKGECLGGCSDCKPSDCQDGTCTAKLEQCTTSLDCACDSFEACAPSREEADERGCAQVTCGDGFCDRDFESQQSCCADCGCQQGYSCKENICLFQPPRISFKPYIYATEISASSLAANPSLTDRSGQPHALIAIELSAEITQTLDTNVTFGIEGLGSHKERLGRMWPGKVSLVAWNLPHMPHLLNITEDINTTLKVSVDYADMKGIVHRPEWEYPFLIKDRNTLDDYGHIAFYVTPEDVRGITGSASNVWDYVGDHFMIEEHDEGIRFAHETLQMGSGSKTDIALLLASIYDNLGMRPSLITSERGLLVRIFDGDRFMILDPGKIGIPYEQARATTIGYEVYDLNDIRKDRNATILSLLGSKHRD